MSTKTTTLYNAGSMFTEAQWKTRKIEGTALRKLFPDFEILNPVDFDTNQTERPTNLDIFVTDYKGLSKSKYVILEIDGWDSGTHMEYGLVFQQAVQDSEKYLFCVMSDFRVPQGILKGEIPGFGINEMISGSFFYGPLNKGDVPQLIVCSSHEKAREAIHAIETGNTKNYRERFDTKFFYTRNESYHGF